MQDETPRLAIIIPAHNEAEYLGRCLASFARQTRVPDQLIVVDDHSTDRTGAIARAFAEQHPWARVVRHTSSAEHQPGPKVVRAFQFGIRQLEGSFTHVGKFDADVVLPEDYFERVLQAFAGNPSLGMCAGHLYIPSGSEWVYENIAKPSHIRGPIKCYSKACYEAIGGLRPFMGWDTADVLLARYHGFEAQTLPGLQAQHLRPTGGAYSVSHARRQGEALYHLRYGLLLAVLAATKMAWKRGNLRVLVHTLGGYFHARRNPTDRMLSMAEGRFARQYRWKGIRARLV